MKAVMKRLLRLPLLTIGAYLLSLGTAIWAYRHECPTASVEQPASLTVRVPLVKEDRCTSSFGSGTVTWFPCSEESSQIPIEEAVQMLIDNLDVQMTKKRVIETPATLVIGKEK